MLKCAHSNVSMVLQQNVASHNVYVTFCRSSVPITPCTTMLMPNFALFEAKRLTVCVVSTPQKTYHKKELNKVTWLTTPLVYYSTYQYHWDTKLQETKGGWQIMHISSIWIISTLGCLDFMIFWYIGYFCIIFWGKNRYKKTQNPILMQVRKKVL
jgi:hypothetical protein